MGCVFTWIKRHKGTLRKSCSTFIHLLMFIVDILGTLSTVLATLMIFLLHIQIIFFFLYLLYVLFRISQSLIPQNMVYVPGLSLHSVPRGTLPYSWLMAFHVSPWTCLIFPLSAVPWSLCHATQPCIGSKWDNTMTKREVGTSYWQRAKKMGYQSYISCILHIVYFHNVSCC